MRKSKSFYEKTCSMFEKTDTLCFSKKDTKDRKTAQKCIELAKGLIKEQKYRSAQFVLTYAWNILITVPNKQPAKKVKA